MIGNQGMVQVLGTTYRVVARADRHDVIRVLDDQLVGAFRHRPCLQVIESKIDSELLLGVAREALQRALLAWRPDRPETSPKSTSWLPGIHAHWGWLLDLLICSLSGLPVFGPAPRRSAYRVALASGGSRGPA
jgi:hypothetical protein